MFARDDRPMSDDMSPNSLEEALRAIAREATRSVERISEMDLDEIARATGIDPDRARGWIDGAGEWLRVQVERVETTPFGGAQPVDRSPRDEDPLRTAGPHPLDVPTAEQGLALAALDSGRWSLEPGTSTLGAHGDGPGPRDALGLVRELRVRDWLTADGELTLTGRHALSRWLDATDRS
jgi:hypothetical protein